MALREHGAEPGSGRARTPIITRLTTLVRGAGEYVATCFSNEASRLFLWLPVCVAVGIGFYFSLVREPGLALVLSIAALGVAALLTLRHVQLFWLSACIMCVALGFSAAKLRTISVHTAQIENRLNNVYVTGWLESVETSRASRWRLIIRPVKISRLDKAQMPARIRLTLRRLPKDLVPGAGISVRAVLLPLPPPVQPGGFDFARSLYFKGLGAIGYPTGKIQRALQDRPAPLMVRVRGAISRLRQSAATRIMAALPGSSGALMAALLVGDRSKLGVKEQKSLRDAGLAHLLAISGLHMALMVGTLFWLIRAGFAMSETLALGYPIKKWAALAALLGGLIYLTLSGAAVSTLRAFIMAAAMCTAILVDRPAITMRNLAIAALIILLSMPESLLSPGFQMSFATVTGLIALNEFRLRRAVNERAAAHGLRNTTIGRLVLYLLGVSLTTIVATLMTAPIAAYHFQRLAVYAIAANMVAIPLMGLWLMPAGLLALVAMPFGLEHYPLLAAGVGADVIVKIAHEIAAWSGAVVITRALPVSALVLCVIGGLWLCLWHRSWRWFGVLPIMLAIVFTTLPSPRADIYVARSGRNIAVRGADGKLGLAEVRRDRFTAARWLQANGDPASLMQARARKVLLCDNLGCHGVVKGVRIAYLKHPAAIAEACSGPLKADIVISQIALLGACSKIAHVIERDDLRRNGAYSIAIEGKTVRVITANQKRGQRPWVIQR